MEVRQIDHSEIKNPKRAEQLKFHIIHHAGHRGSKGFIGLDTSQNPDRSLIIPGPATSPLSFLIKRALNPNPTRGKTSRPKGLAQGENIGEPDAQATVLRNEAGSHHHAGTAGVVLEPPTRSYEPLFPPHSFSGRPAPYHLNAGRIGTDSKDATPLEVRSAPDSPAPSYCINNGTPIPVDADHNAELRTRDALDSFLQTDHLGPKFPQWYTPVAPLHLTPGSKTSAVPQRPQTLASHSL